MTDIRPSGRPGADLPEIVPVTTPADDAIERHLLARIEHTGGRSADDVLAYAAFCSRTGQPARAVPHLERLAEASRPSAAGQVLLVAGQLLEQARDFRGALARYQRGVAARSADADTRYFLENNRAYCMNQLGYAAPAECAARAAIAIVPARYNAHKNLGVALEGLGRSKDAVRAYLRAIECAPTEGRALAHLEDLVARQSDLLRELPGLSGTLAELRHWMQRLERRLH